MSNTYNIFSDTHLYGVDPVCTLAEIKAKQDGILIGDIVDIKNAKKKEHDLAIRDKNELQIIFKEKYVSGNHELCFDNLSYIVNGILFVHGDFQLWGEQKATDFRNKSPKGGLFSRFLSTIIDVGRDFAEAKITEEQIDSCQNEAIKRGCHTIVMGHKHPNNQIQIKSPKGINIYILKRGYTQLII